MHETPLTSSEPPLLDDAGEAIAADDEGEIERRGKSRRAAAIVQRPWWPEEVPRPSSPPRVAPSKTADRFVEAARFGDDLQAQPLDTRPAPNVIFQNSLLTSRNNKKSALPDHFQLPEKLRFYVRISFQKVGFPFPHGVSQKKYLLTATRVGGADGAPATAEARIEFDQEHVIGLTKFHMQTFAQLVLEVPSTADVNPTLNATRLAFHPRHFSQLHRSATGGSERSEGLPRLIVPIWPLRVTPQPHAIEYVPRPRPSVGTFGSADGRMGPAFMSLDWQQKLLARWQTHSGDRAAAVVASKYAHDGSSSIRMSKRPKPPRRAPAQEAAAPPPRDDLSDVTSVSDSQSSERRVMRPSFMMA